MKAITIRTVAAAALAAAISGCTPSDGAKELELGRQAYAVHDLKKAEKMFTKSAELSPDNADALLFMARVKLELGELKDAQTWIAKAAAVAGNDADVKLVEAQIAWHAKNSAKAADLFKAVAEDTKLPPEIRAKGSTGLGVVEHTNENGHLARIAFLRAIRLNRHEAAAWYHLGLVYRDTFSYYEAALEQFEIFVRLEESASPRVQKTLRTTIPALKEQIAREAANRPGVAKRDSAASATALAKAEAAWKKGNYRNARDAYQAALAADPLSYPAALGLGKAWLKTDNSKEGARKALESYKTACTLRPGAISTFLATGDIAARQGQHAMAMNIFSRAVAASPTSIQALDGLIRAMQKSGGNKTAARAYQRYRDFIASSKK